MFCDNSQHRSWLCLLRGGRDRGDTPGPGSPPAVVALSSASVPISATGISGRIKITPEQPFLIRGRGFPNAGGRSCLPSSAGRIRGCEGPGAVTFYPAAAGRVGLPPTVSTASLLCRHLPEPEGGSLAAPVAGGQSDAQVTQGWVNGARPPWEGRPSVLAVLATVAAVPPAQTRGAGGDCAFWPTSARPLETCCPRVTITCTPFRSLKHRCGQ